MQQSAPQPALPPVARVFPRGTLDDAAKAGAEHGDVVFERRTDLVAQFAQPLHATRGDAIRLGHDERAPIARIQLGEQALERGA